MDETHLEKLGLTKIEAKIYLSILKMGSTKAGALVKTTSLHRATVYDTLKRLVEKGLVSYIIRGRIKYFQATSPEYFLEKLKEDENKLREKGVFAKELVKEMNIIKSDGKIKEESSVYEGLKGVRLIFEDMLKSKEYLCLGSKAKLKNILGGYFDIFQQRKKHQKVKARLLFDENLKNSEYLRGIYGKVKFLSKEYSSPTSTFIYKNKVVIIVDKEVPTAFLLENEELAESFKAYFEILWKVAKY